MKKNSKQYYQEWYKKNRQRVLDKVKLYYINNKESILEYHHARNPLDKILKKKRRDAHLESHRDKESLYAHKMAKVLAKKRKNKQHESYIEKQEKTISPHLRETWTEGEIEYLENNYKTKTITELAIFLGRTYAATSRKLNKLRLIKIPQRIGKLL